MRDHKGLSFPIEEYQRRLDELRKRMVRRRFDVVIITSPENIFYLTGYQTTGYSYFQSLVVPLEREPYMVTRLLESTNIESRTWVEDYRAYNDTGDAIQTIWHSLCEFNLANKYIGFEKDCYFFPTYQQERLQATMDMQDGGLYDCSGIVDGVRVIKSDLEVEILRRAAKATEAGMGAGMAAVRAGITENDVAAEIHHAMFKAGGEYPAVAPYVTSGPRCLIGHATWEGRTIEKDECVFLEIGGCYRRYHTAMMRTAFTGKVPDVMREAEKLTLEALEAMMEQMRPGVTVHDVDAVPRHILNKSHVGGNLLTRSGYSIGIAFAPAWDEGSIISLKPGESEVLRRNMVFHIIPWLHGLDGGHVMCTSETVRVTEDGCESFFNTERKLFEAA